MIISLIKAFNLGGYVSSIGVLSCLLLWAVSFEMFLLFMRLEWLQLIMNVVHEGFCVGQKYFGSITCKVGMIPFLLKGLSVYFSPPWNGL